MFVGSLDQKWSVSTVFISNVTPAAPYDKQKLVFYEFDDLLLNQFLLDVRRCIVARLMFSIVEVENSRFQFQATVPLTIVQKLQLIH